MAIVKAPFTDEQVRCLEKWQEYEHPFTCSRDSCRQSPNEGALTPTNSGWRCENEGCSYTQDWAHDFMLAYDGPKLIRFD